MTALYERRHRASTRRVLAGIVIVAAAIVGPMAEVSSAASHVQIFVEGWNVAAGEAEIDDTGAYDFWHGVTVSETQGPDPFNTICASQGYRDLVLENSNPRYLYEGVFSGYKGSCVFGFRYVEMPSRWTGEEWDMRFAWKSVNTPYNDFVEIGTIDA
jgi:hypothetical protein